MNKNDTVMFATDKIQSEQRKGWREEAWKETNQSDVLRKLRCSYTDCLD